MSAAVMMEPFSETSPRFKANIAVVVFLTSILTGGAAAFVRWRLVVPGDAVFTATNILAHAALFQMLLAADVISIVCYVAMTMIFYELFKPMNRHLSTLTAFFSLTGCVIVAFGSLFHIAALVVIRGAQYLNVLTVQPLPALTLMCLRLRAEAYSVSLAFFGVYCVLIGYLIFRSTFLPRIVALLMPTLIILIALPAFASNNAFANGRAHFRRAIAPIERAVAVTPGKETK